MTLIGGRPPRPHARLAGRHRDRQHRVAEVGGGDVPGRRARPRRSSPSRARATPTWPGCRSTGSPTPATCSSGPRPARPRRGWRRAAWPRRSSPSSAIAVLSHVVALGRAVATGGRRPAPEDLDAVDDSEVRCFDPEAERADDRRRSRRRPRTGDSLGGVVEVLAYGVPVGLGSHVHWDRKLDGLLAQALMSIQAVKAVELGEGVRPGRPAGLGGPRRRSTGTPGRAELSGGYVRRTHRAGGIEGGISTGGAGRRPGGHEAARHAEPAGARDGRRGDEGGGGRASGSAPT